MMSTMSRNHFMCQVQPSDPRLHWGYSWDTIWIQPIFNHYQLIGDSLLVRFAEKILNQPNRITNGVRTLGLCVSGQRIDQLRQKIKRNVYPLTPNVMVLIGTNDVLCGGDYETMLKHFKRLLRQLKKKRVEKLLILTLPPIPKLCISYDHWSVIRQYNNYLKSLHNGTTIVVADICPLFTKFTGALEYQLPIASPKKNTNINVPLNFQGLKNRSLIKERLESIECEKKNNSDDKEKRNVHLEGNNNESEFDWDKNTEISATDGARPSKESYEVIILKTPETPIKKGALENELPIASPKKNTNINVPLNFQGLKNRSLIKERLESIEYEKKDNPEDQENSNVHLEGNNNESEFDWDKNTEISAADGAKPSKESHEVIIPKTPETPIKKGIKRGLGSDEGLETVYGKFGSDDDETSSLMCNTPKSLKLSPRPTRIFALCIQDILKSKKTSPSANEKLVQSLPISDVSEEVKKSRLRAPHSSLSGADHWAVETDDESIGEHVYVSQEDISYNNLDESKSERRTRTNDFLNYLNTINNRQSNPAKKLTVEYGKDTKDAKEEKRDCEYEDISDNENDIESKSSATSEDDGYKKQLYPRIDYKFLQFLEESKKMLQKSPTTERDSGIFRRSSLNKGEAYVEEMPSFTYSSKHLPLSVNLFMVPPPPPPPMPTTPIYKSGAFKRINYENKMNMLEGLSERDGRVLTYSHDICFMDYYEYFYCYGKKRIDLIHLNQKGLQRIKDYLIENKLV